ncbi:hypothetical protein [Bacillus thuringiensis]|uniref:hypothetical protein n=1 Tax=Bacillus thuringiensis TaxID=1428 RepID=UPI000A35F9A7|nr:hypothetical protein [Bacillus thuringiensis]OUA52278.1 hypothetical protein BK785_21235 [Bacillus thuringiensis serovar bolivia]OUA71913.1 hypothetical protein BK787_25585 [Bacillus thuringiensis serovar pahangi]
MKKTVEKILKDIIDSTSITDMCDKSVCHWLQSVVDTIVFPGYYVFSSTHLKENIISLLIVFGVLLIFGLIVEEMMKRIFKKNEEKYMWIHKVFEKVMVAFLLFYGIKTIIYFIALKHH